MLQSFLELSYIFEALQVTIVAIIIALVAAKYLSKDVLSKYPLINDKLPGELFYTKRKLHFVTHAKELIEEGFTKANKAFRLLTDDGIQIVLSPEWADAIRDNENLNFSRISEEDYHGHIPGFDPFKQGTLADRIFHRGISSHMNAALERLSEPLSAEVDFSLKQYFTDSREWHEISLQSCVTDIVSQLSSRVFLGEEICRNPDWHRFTVDYTAHTIEAGQELRLWPKALRSYVHWVLPCCQKIRSELADARKIIAPVLERRRREKAATEAQGKPPAEYLDALEWMEVAAKGQPYDPAVIQVMLAFSANMTGSDALCQVIFDLSQREELVKDMRREIINVLGKNGWNKSTLYKLKLMDSVLKESQRMKPAAVGLMRRYAMKETEFPDGTPMPQGTKIMVSVHESWDPSVFSNAQEFDGYRFLKMREEGDKENAAQFVSTGKSILGFGYGKQACPGRFFAANELKIALCHILLKYDLKPAQGPPPKPLTYGLYYIADPVAKIAVRRRQGEIDF
ncbi:cytochrome P450 protein [Rutstroemia sp. NJR-2017a WRK4]|nr:cytochrome P450 protein [Rutstroemia sp. NJR-2017a WRK4]